jgi:hypothetical protein
MLALLSFLLSSHMILSSKVLSAVLHRSAWKPEIKSFDVFNASSLSNEKNEEENDV